MQVDYTEVKFKIIPFGRNGLTSESSVLFRSMFGKILRREFCIFTDRICDECSINHTCGYSVLFESVGENDEIRRKEHPYVFSFDGNTLKIVFFGDAGRRYSSKIYPLIYEIGEIGLGNKRSRIKFSSAIIGEEQGTWIFSEDNSPCKANFYVSFDTPFRIQKNGKLIDQPNLDILFRSIYRRARAICRYYGQLGEATYQPLNGIAEEKANFYWVDWKHYSQRQKISMKLGGVCGIILAKGYISESERSLLEFGRISGVGKNTAFGLGHITWGYFSNTNI